MSDCTQRKIQIPELSASLRPRRKNMDLKQKPRHGSNTWSSVQHEVGQFQCVSVRVCVCVCMKVCVVCLCLGENNADDSSSCLSAAAVTEWCGSFRRFFMWTVSTHLCARVKTNFSGWVSLKTISLDTRCYKLLRTVTIKLFVDYTLESEALGSGTSQNISFSSICVLREEVQEFGTFRVRCAQFDFYIFSPFPCFGPETLYQQDSNCN